MNAAVKSLLVVGIYAVSCFAQSTATETGETGNKARLSAPQAPTLEDALLEARKAALDAREAALRANEATQQLQNYHRPSFELTTADETLPRRQRRAIRESENRRARLEAWRWAGQSPSRPTVYITPANPFDMLGLHRKHLEMLSFQPAYAFYGGYYGTMAVPAYRPGRILYPGYGYLWSGY